MDFWFCLYRETGFKMMWSGRDFWLCLYRETLFKVKRYSGGFWNVFFIRVLAFLSSLAVQFSLYLISCEHIIVFSPRG